MRAGGCWGLKDSRVGVLQLFPACSDSSSPGKGEVQGSHLQTCSHQLLVPFFCPFAVKHIWGRRSHSCNNGV